jgi:nucleoside-diphosphate-sugar epimerase
MSKILCTGGAGYIGSVLVPALLAQGHEVLVIDRLLYEPTALNACFIYPHFNFKRLDVRYTASYAHYLREAEVFIPLACLVGAPICDRLPGEAREVNFGAVRAALKFLDPACKVLFPTTNSGYGASAEPVNEESPLKPLSLYAQTKVEAELAVLNRGNALTFRLATAFGASPRMRLDLLVNDFTYRAVRDRYLTLFEPHYRRNYIHVRDIAGVFLYALDHFDEMRGKPYNVGLSEANLTKIELCDRIRRVVPEFHFVVGPGADQDKRDYLVDNTRIEATGWKPRHSLDEGLIELRKLFNALSNSRYGNV